MAGDGSKVSDASTPEERRRVRDRIRLGVSAALVVLLVLFVVLNTDKTRVDFVVTAVEVPLIFVLVGTALVGAGAAALAQYALRRRRGE